SATIFLWVIRRAPAFSKTANHWAHVFPVLALTAASPISVLRLTAMGTSLRCAQRLRHNPPRETSMARKDPRIDAYLKTAAPYARPVLVRVRKIVQEACPDVVETLKWNNPAFEHHGLLAGFA